jgi:drug/metabolite transporter (DMT)-like permease
VTAGSSGARTLGTVYTLLSAAAWSLAGLLQRQLQMSVATQLAGRAVFAFAALLVFVAVAERGRVIRAFRATGRAGLLVAGLMAVSSISFLTALNDAPVADVMVIQALAPLAAALLGLLAGEPVRPRTWAAMGVAVAGFAVMAGAPSRPPLAGTVFSLLAMLGYAAMIVVSRRKSDVSMAPATCASQVLVFAVFAPAAHVSQLGGSGLGYLALMGIVQMGLGLLFISLGARLIPAVEVALIAQLENVLAPLWVWLAGFERPSPATVVGGVVVLAAVAVQVTAPGPGGADLGLESWRDDRQDPLAGFGRGWGRRRRQRSHGVRRGRAACPDGEPG